MKTINGTQYVTQDEIVVKNVTRQRIPFLAVTFWGRMELGFISARPANEKGEYFFITKGIKGFRADRYACEQMILIHNNVKVVSVEKALELGVLTHF